MFSLSGWHEIRLTWYFGLIFLQTERKPAGKNTEQCSHTKLKATNKLSGTFEQIGLIWTNLDWYLIKRVEANLFYIYRFIVQFTFKAVFTSSIIFSGELFSSMYFSNRWFRLALNIICQNWTNTINSYNMKFKII